MIIDSSAIEKDEYEKGVLACIGHLCRQREDAMANGNTVRRLELDNAQNSLYYVLNEHRKERNV